MAGIYGGAASAIGGVTVSSAPQASIVGWNGIPITPTYLAAGNYWLAYSYNTVAGYTVFNTTSTTAGAFAFTDGVVPFGTMPANMPATISYDATGSAISDAIYAVYCDAPTNTPTPSNTPTYSKTPTLSPTATITSTPTNTGTVSLPARLLQP